MPEKINGPDLYKSAIIRVRKRTPHEGATVSIFDKNVTVKTNAKHGDSLRDRFKRAVGLGAILVLLAFASIELLKAGQQPSAAKPSGAADHGVDSHESG